MTRAYWNCFKQHQKKVLFLCFGTRNCILLWYHDFLIRWVDLHCENWKMDRISKIMIRQSVFEITVSDRRVKEDVRDKVDFLHADKRQKFLQINSFILGAWGQACRNYSKTSLLFLCNILRKRWVMKLIFLNADKHESLKINIKIDTVILMGMVKYSQSFQNIKFAMSLQYLKADFNTLSIKISYKVILSLLMGMTTSSQSTQSNKFTISLQCLEKYVLDGVHFLHADKHQNFYKLPLLFLMKVAKHVQSTQNRKLVIFLQCIKKMFGNAFVFYSVAKHSDILQESSHVCFYLFAKIMSWASFETVMESFIFNSYGIIHSFLAFAYCWNMLLCCDLTVNWVLVLFSSVELFLRSKTKI